MEEIFRVKGHIFYVLLTVYLSIILVTDQLNAQILVSNKFIIKQEFVH